MSGLRAKRKSSAQIQSEGAASSGGKGGGLIKGLIMGAVGVPSLGAAVGAEGAATALPSDAANTVESTGTFDAATGEGITGASTVKVDPSTGEGISALTPTAGSTNYADKISSIYSVGGKKPSWFQNILTDGQAGEQYRQRAYVAELNKAGALSALTQQEAANQLAIDRQLNPSLREATYQDARRMELVKAYADNIRKSNAVVNVDDPNAEKELLSVLKNVSLSSAAKSFELAPQVTQKQIEKDQASIAASEASTRASDTQANIAKSVEKRASDKSAILDNPKVLTAVASALEANAGRQTWDAGRLDLSANVSNIPVNQVGAGTVLRGSSLVPRTNQFGQVEMVQGGPKATIGGTEVDVSRLPIMNAAIEAANAKQRAGAGAQPQGVNQPPSALAPTVKSMSDEEWYQIQMQKNYEAEQKRKADEMRALTNFGRTFSPTSR